MKTNEIKVMMLEVCKKLIAEEKRLCELDSVIGDGDHGVTVARGFSQAQIQLESNDYLYPADIFETVGHMLSVTMGGAIGPLLGSFFSAGTKKLKGKENFEKQDFLLLFEEGLKRIKLLGGAQEGDRTMIDALAPAVYAMKEACKEEKSLNEVLEAAAAAAVDGAQHTKEMVAKKGRARFLGEKSLGHVDAGAMTISLIITGMKDCID